MRRGRPVANGDGVPHALVQLGQGPGPEHDLAGRVEAVPGQDRRPHRFLRCPTDDGHGEAVDLQRAEPVTGPRRHLGVVVEEPRRLGGGDIANAAARDQRVVPVPSVEAGVGHQGVEARAEHHGGDDDDDRQHGAEDGRAHRHGIGPGPGLHGEADPGHGGNGKAAVGRGCRNGRGPMGAPPPAPGGPVRGALDGQHDGQRAENDDERQHAEAEHGPVRGDTRMGIDGTHGSEWRQRGERHRHRAGQERTHNHRAADPEQPVAHGHARVGP